MPTGYTSSVINGQLVNVAPAQAFNPLTFGQAYTGPAMWPRQGVYNVPPVLPSAALQGSMAPQAYGASPNSETVGTSGFPLPTATSASGNPFHGTKSPLLWALFFLGAGLLMLQHVHWRKG
jgi:hypothetical protein